MNQKIRDIMKLIQLSERQKKLLKIPIALEDFFKEKLYNGNNLNVKDYWKFLG